MFEKIKSFLFQEKAVPKKNELNKESFGASGTSYFSGMFNEEYLPTLQGTNAAQVYDEMRRSDSRIKMLLSAVIDPIVGAQWDIEAAGTDEIEHEQAEFVKFALMDDSGQSFKAHVREAMGHLIFGHAVFELIHKVAEHPEFGKYIGYKRIAWRSQKTIHSWGVDTTSGNLKYIEQLITGDFVQDLKSSIVTIPGQYLLVITNQKEGDNFEGISDLRPCYGNYFRKNLFLKLTGIGIERNAIGTIIGTVPEGEIATAQASDFERILQDYISHESGYILKSKGWEVEIKTNNFDPDKIISVIRFENDEMVQAFLANFLNLGQGGNGGAYALSNDLSDFFFNAIKSKADAICEAHNKKTIKELIDFNFGPQEKYPKLVYRGLDDKVGLEFSQLVKNYIDSGAITPDSELEKFLRKVNKLPEKKEVEKVEAPEPTPEPEAQKAQVEVEDETETTEAEIEMPEVDKEEVQLSEISLAEKTPWSFMGEQTNIVKTFMQVRIRMIGDRLISDVLKKYKALPENSKRDALKNNDVGFLTQYKKDLRTLLAQTATDAINQAKKEVPGGNKIKFADDPFTKLNKQVKALVQATVDMIVNAQGGDIEKTIYAQYNTSVDSTNDYAIIEQDLSDALKTYTEGPSVNASAGNSVALVTNSARNMFFEFPEVANKIESFTFKNPRPETVVCKELTGKTFSVSDAESMRYAPPLHHNCKSYLSPNYKGEKNPTPTGLNPSAAAKKTITLENISIGGAVTLADTANLVMQTLILGKYRFQTDSEAKNWIESHNFNSSKIDETENSFRFRQREPEDFIEGSFVSKELTNGVTAVFGRLKSA